ncbi:MAG TPA: hypothetical protein VMH33_07495 [Solirubrobacterales bacterium]|nr:hypothetical protein [Solirubrobacterales bacterium]
MTVICLAMAWFTIFSGAAAARPPSLRLSPAALGPVRFGMDARQASAALGAQVEVDPGINGCNFWTLPGFSNGAQTIALHGRLAYAEIYRRGPKTTRGITVGDGISRLRHRYRGRLHGGRSGSLGAAENRLFASEVRGGATYELEFDIWHTRVIHISAGTRRTIETFGECA